MLYVVRHGVYWGPGENPEGSEEGAEPGCATCSLCGHPPPDEGAPVADEGAGPVADEGATPVDDEDAALVNDGAPASEVEEISNMMEGM